MFFSGDLFESYLSPKDADAIAKICNQIISRNGIVMFGVKAKAESGETVLGYFTTKQKKDDTHKCIAIGLKELSLFSDLGRVEAEEPTESELVRLQKQTNQMLQRENKSLRSGNNE